MLFQSKSQITEYGAQETLKRIDTTKPEQSVTFKFLKLETKAPNQDNSFVNIEEVSNTYRHHNEKLPHDLNQGKHGHEVNYLNRQWNEDLSALSNSYSATRKGAKSGSSKIFQHTMGDLEGVANNTPEPNWHKAMGVIFNQKGNYKQSINGAISGQVAAQGRKSNVISKQETNVVSNHKTNVIPSHQIKPIKQNTSAYSKQKVQEQAMQRSNTFLSLEIGTSGMEIYSTKRTNKLVDTKQVLNILHNQEISTISYQGNGKISSQAGKVFPNQETNEYSNQKRIQPANLLSEPSPNILADQGTKHIPNQKAISSLNLEANLPSKNIKITLTAKYTSMVKFRSRHKNTSSTIDLSKRGIHILHQYCGDSLYNSRLIGFSKKNTALAKVHLLVILNTPHWKVSKQFLCSLSIEKVEYLVKIRK